MLKRFSVVDLHGFILFVELLLFFFCYCENDVNKIQDPYNNHNPSCVKLNAFIPFHFKKAVLLHYITPIRLKENYKECK